MVIFEFELGILSLKLILKHKIIVSKNIKIYKAFERDICYRISRKHTLIYALSSCIVNEGKNWFLVESEKKS